MSDINYKLKYQALKAKFMSSVDTAFRMGFEQGVMQAQQDQMMQQMAQPPMDDSQDPNAVNPQAEQQESEIDKHIAELESLLANKEASNEEIQKSLHSIKSFRKKLKEDIEFKKSSMAISEISKNLHKPQFKLNVQAVHNLNENSKKTNNLQQKIIDDVFKSWEKEESKAGTDITKLLELSNLIKE
jgi:hypothetical protein